MEPLEESKILSFLFYGVAGAGKSIMAAGSKTLRTAIIDCDNGTYSVLRYCQSKGIDTKLKMRKQVTSYRDFSAAMKVVTEMANKNEVDLVVLDTVTKLQSTIISGILDSQGITKLDFMSSNDKGWNDVLNIMRSIANMFGKLPCSWVWLAHEQTKRVENVEISFPLLQGAFGKEVDTNFSVIGRCVKTIDKVIVGGKPQYVSKRETWFAQSPTFMTKDRTFSLPNKINTDIGMDGILETIESKVFDKTSNIIPVHVSDET